MALLKEIADVQTGPFGSQLHKEDYVEVGTPIVTVEHLGNRIFTEQNLPMVSDEDKERLSKYILQEGDIVFSRVGSVDRCSYVDGAHDGWLFSGRCLRIRPNHNVDAEYLYYFFTKEETKQLIRSIAVGATMPSINTNILNNVEVQLPSLVIQRKIARVLSVIDKKIEVNNEINRNLSEQLKVLFIELFGDEICKNKMENGVSLGELIDVIDNRGKTPPLTTDITEYPIIDVGALRGDIRVIDFNNCTKFVTEETYNDWFRSGHPKPWDILLSTVGSLAEMKIFLGEKGCIAQNVVALRSKGISPLYLYQYLQFIRYDLVAYNIGSVQPSIKVTHIIKHPIFVPEENRIKEFDELARTITEQIYNLYCENEDLKGIRNVLLPKLMSGELDLSDVDL